MATERPGPTGAIRRRKTTLEGAARERLLSSAGEVFAAVGFRRATLREISARADINMAMVKYYFGGKENLYRAVLDRFVKDPMRRAVPAPQTGGFAPVEVRLSACVTGLLVHALDRSVSGALIAGETLDPTALELDVVVDTFLRPYYAGIHLIVREVMGSDAPEEEARWCEEGIRAQCLHYRNARRILDRLHPDQRYGPEEIKALADHITRFSLEALRAICARSPLERAPNTVGAVEPALSPEQEAVR